MGNEKKCSKCGLVKPLTDFYELKSGGTRASCKACETIRRREYRQKNQAKENAHRRAYNASLPEEKKREKREWHKGYYAEHRDELVRKKVAYHKERLASDPVYARKKELSMLVNRVLHRGQNPKAATTAELERILGCSLQVFRAHFFATWEDKYGEPWAGQKFEIDHITPLNDAKTIPEVEKLFNYKNLRCITPFDNKTKYIN